MSNQKNYQLCIHFYSNVDRIKFDTDNCIPPDHGRQLSPARQMTVALGAWTLPCYDRSTPIWACIRLSVVAICHSFNAHTLVCITIAIIITAINRMGAWVMIITEQLDALIKSGELN